jgi:predicted acetyltransferase
MLCLVQPSRTYKESFIESVREFQKEGRWLYFDLNSLISDYDGFLQSVRNQADKTKVRRGRVPSTEYWLIDGDEFIGTLNIRHELNDYLYRIAGHIGYSIRPSKRRRGYGKEILRLGLQKAKERGLTRVLITCDEDNIGSKKIIEYNGGVFENAVTEEGSPVRKLRFWIDIDPTNGES